MRPPFRVHHTLPLTTRHLLSTEWVLYHQRPLTMRMTTRCKIHLDNWFLPALASRPTRHSTVSASLTLPTVSPRLEKARHSSLPEFTVGN